MPKLETSVFAHKGRGEHNTSIEPESSGGSGRSQTATGFHVLITFP